MNTPQPFTPPAAAAPRPVDDVLFYQGVDLAPKTLESLVTWDVSVHARQEQDRLSSAVRQPTNETLGGY